MPDPCLGSSRRQFLAQAAATVGALTVVRSAHADGDGTERLRIGLIGCGGRGGKAVVDALSADSQAELVALGDAFADRAAACLQQLQKHDQVGDRVTATPERVFADFDAYKQVIDCGVDVVILAAPPHFRPRHLAYAVEQGKHVFAEKPVAVDVPGALQVAETCRLAETKGLSIVSGLCWRYDLGVRETMDRINNGAIGEIIAIESAYNAGSLWHRGDDPNWSRMEYQIRNWLYWTWLSGDHIVEQAIHSLDKPAWLHGDASPATAVGLGGRQQRTDPKFGNIFDHHAVFYKFANGAPVYFTCRQQANTATHVDELVLGSKGTAQILANRIDGQTSWRYRGPKPSMYLREHEELFASIRRNQPINNGDYMVNSTLMAIMGRMATYTGQEISWDQLLASTERLGPEAYAWGDAPESAVAIPGVTALRIEPATS